MRCVCEVGKPYAPDRRRAPHNRPGEHVLPPKGAVLQVKEAKKRRAGDVLDGAETQKVLLGSAAIRCI
eukprot:1746332-Pleurochrysis_carterae.AAC.1